MVSENLVKNPIKTIFGSSQHGYSSDSYELAGSGRCATAGRDTRDAGARLQPYDALHTGRGWAARGLRGRCVRGYAAVQVRVAWQAA